MVKTNSTFKSTPDEMQLERSQAFIKDTMEEIKQYKIQQKTAIGNDKIWLDRLIPKKEKALNDAIAEVKVLKKNIGGENIMMDTDTPIKLQEMKALEANSK